MANTRGGMIVYGVAEKKGNQRRLQGRTQSDSQTT